MPPKHIIVINSSDDEATPRKLREPRGNQLRGRSSADAIEIDSGSEADAEEVAHTDSVNGSVNGNGNGNDDGNGNDGAAAEDDATDALVNQTKSFCLGVLPAARDRPFCRPFLPFREFLEEWWNAGEEEEDALARRARQRSESQASVAPATQPDSQDSSAPASQPPIPAPVKNAVLAVMNDPMPAAVAPYLTGPAMRTSEEAHDHVSHALAAGRLDFLARLHDIAWPRMTRKLMPSSPFIPIPSLRISANSMDGVNVASLMNLYTFVAGSMDYIFRRKAPRLLVHKLGPEVLAMTMQKALTSPTDWDAFVAGVVPDGFRYWDTTKDEVPPNWFPGSGGYLGLKVNEDDMSIEDAYLGETHERLEHGKQHAGDAANNDFTMWAAVFDTPRRLLTDAYAEARQPIGTDDEMKTAETALRQWLAVWGITTLRLNNTHPPKSGDWVEWARGHDLPLAWRDLGTGNGSNRNYPIQLIL